MNSSTYTISGLLAALALAIPSAASAQSFNVAFSAGNFSPVFNGVPPPVNNVSGNITYSATNFGAPITSIDSIDLSIDGHTFSVAEVGGRYQTFAYFFGGLVNGINSIDQASQAPDFILSFLTLPPGNVSSPSFLYTTAEGSDTWRSAALTVVLTPVPEANSAALLLLGLGALVAVRRRF